MGGEYEQVGSSMLMLKDVITWIVGVGSCVGESNCERFQILARAERAPTD